MPRGKSAKTLTLLTKNNMAAVAVFTLIILGIVYIVWPQVQPPLSSVGGGVTTTQVSTTLATAKDAAQLQWSVKSLITRTARITATTEVDIIRAGSDGIFDLSNRLESTTVNSTPEQSAAYFKEGERLLLHVLSDLDPTGGTDHYDQWYTVTLSEGQPVRMFTLAQASAIGGGKYSISDTGEVVAGSTVKYTSGNTKYWDIDDIYAVERSTAANIDVSLTHSGATLSSLTDGSSWRNPDASGNTDRTFTTTDETVKLNIDLGATGIGYGTPMITLSSAFELQERKTVVFISFNVTSIGKGKLSDKGWIPISVQPDADRTFYKVIPEFKGTTATKGAWTTEIPFDMASVTGSTWYNLRVWIIDFQLVSDAAQGTSSSTVPTAYGAINEFGIDAMIFARPYTETSGVPASGALGLEWRVVV